MKELCVFYNNILEAVDSCQSEFILEKCKGQYGYSDEVLEIIKNNISNEIIKRIYVGDEFCQFAFPTLDEWHMLIENLLKKELKLTIVTPSFNDDGLRMMDELLEIVKEKDQDNILDVEVVCNEWGMLYRLHKKHTWVKVVAGRLLNKSIKEYRYSSIENERMYTKEGMRYIQQIALLDESHATVLKDYRLDRCEIDMLPQGIDLSNNTKTLSMYLPFTFISTGRQCSVRSAVEGDRFLLGNSCQRHCYKLSHQCSAKNGDVKIFRKGNAFFVFATNAESIIDNQSIDRIVLQL